MTLFLSTPSVRRATRVLQHRTPLEDISIHALREEGDSVPAFGLGHGDISIHALREEGDPDLTKVQHGLEISIHALREEGDTCYPYFSSCDAYFYPRPP